MSIVGRRNKLQIYYDILSAIRDESNNGEVKPTRVQLVCKMSYDKMSKYLVELKSRKMITNPSLKVADKGYRFLEDYENIKGFLEEMKIEYLQTEDKIEG